ncbi:hypothetical protein Ciccas_007597 [Cichlidogyrus casuarinus]|uniref:Protein kinase domain-containing protein n=1 Tax=Cichlidogyrus casuarinus TaxID=1844966 RepID=A0ABD2Q2F1_9PLAT
MMGSGKTINNFEYTFELQSIESDCDEGKSLSDLIEHTIGNNNPSRVVIAVLAALCSQSIKALSAFSDRKNQIIISPTAESVPFNEHFFQMVPHASINKLVLLSFCSHSLASLVLIKTLKYFEWKRIGLIRQDDLFMKPDEFARAGLEVVADFSKSGSKLSYDIVQNKLKEFNEKIVRVFIVELLAEDSALVMCAAYKLGMTADNGYVFFYNPWLAQNWFKEESVKTEQCTQQDEMLKAAFYTFKLTIRNLIQDFNGKVRDIIVESDSSYPIDGIPVIHFNKLNHRIGTQWTLEQIAPTTNNEQGTPQSFTLNDVITYTLDDTYLPKLTETTETLKYEEFTDMLQLSEKRTPNWGMEATKPTPDDGSHQLYDDCSFKLISQAFQINCFSSTIIASSIIVVSFLMLIVLASVYYYRRRMLQAEKQVKQPFDELCLQLNHLEIHSEDLVINRKVGKGAFGTVYGGELKRASDQGNRWIGIAVKRLVSDKDYEAKIDFLSEANLMKDLDHKNVVKLIGVCLHRKDGHLDIVMELLPLGDLKMVLLSNRELFFSENVKDKHLDIIKPVTLTKMAKDIALGLKYLHDKQLLHRDIACRNCLVDRDYTVKLGDFGLTRQAVSKNEDAYYRFRRNCQLPIRWMSPEAIQMGVFSVKSDLWSYGILLYEIITFGVFPYEHYTDHEVVEHLKAGLCITQFLPRQSRNTDVSVASLKIKIYF